MECNFSDERFSALEKLTNFELKEMQRREYAAEEERRRRAGGSPATGGTHHQAHHRGSRGEVAGATTHFPSHHPQEGQCCLIYN